MARLLTIRHQLVAISTGIVYLWFGALKFFPGLSPAESLAKATLDRITFGLVPVTLSYPTLAVWEVALGVLFLVVRPRPWMVYLAITHLLLTFSPLWLLPELCFQSTNAALTLVGQYIIKNLILLSALLFLLPAKPAQIRV